MKHVEFSFNECCFDDRALATRATNVGFSAGGAKDINNFRENIQHGFMPQKTDVTMEGIFYDYYFDTGDDVMNHDKMVSDSQKQDLFYPTYSQGILSL